MILNEFKLHNYRNYENLNITFSDGIHILKGKNAQGKTNLLEAILYLSTTRSHRTNDDRDLLKQDSDAFFIKGLIVKKEIKEDIQISVNEKGKNLFIYKNYISKVSDFIGEFNAVMFCPDDMMLFNASPRVRRRFVDMELSKISKKYVSTLFVAQKLLKERNVYLKQSVVDRNYLEVLTTQLIDMQIIIIKQRYYFLDQLVKKCQKFYQELSMDQTKISITYESCIPFVEDDNKLKELLNDKYKKSLERDILFKQTTIGIHKEDFIFKINNKDLSIFASQGQKRSVLLALKIGMIYMIKEIIKEYPVLLLDDVFSELDENRKQKLLTSLPNEIQIFISTTDMKDLEDIKKYRKVTIWNVENGKIEKM
ncbi:MAG: DNA replication/repair protein RecF [Longicatena sp.]